MVAPSARAGTRTVWRTVLSSPLSVEWPPEAFSSSSDLASWLAQHCPGRRRRRCSSRSQGQEAMQVVTAESDAQETDQISSSSPVAGITAVLKFLEDRIVLGAGKSDLPGEAVLLVSKADVSPASLVAPIPQACAAAHAAGYKVYLAPLPRGSEPVVARALGVRRAAAVLIPVPPASGHPGAVVNIPLLNEALSSPFPSEVRPGPALPVRIKHVRSVAPLDMNKAKEAKKAARAARAERRRKRTSDASGPKRVPLPKQAPSSAKNALLVNQAPSSPPPTKVQAPSNPSATPVVKEQAQAPTKTDKSNPFMKARAPASTSSTTTPTTTAPKKVKTKKGLKGLL